MTIHTFITAEDIRDGLRCSGALCPPALAIKRVLAQSNMSFIGVRVRYSSAAITFPDGTRKVGLLDYTTTAFMTAFDVYGRDNLKPIPLKITFLPPPPVTDTSESASLLT